ncbi:MAG: pyruvate dehydrogenase complex dihydrolipoamide acetyltransferase [Rhodospirillaceae bacterium]|nr:pyruvate dehydrogenase complex dihydrolipoamide acetyltransferase [Rhodospirillaceae bacterium]
MPQKILMPALSPTMTEGKLAKWLKKEGDKVSPGDPIAEIETDKATMEVEAVDEGTIGKILVAEGSENVPVNSPIALLLEEGEDASALAQESAAAKPDAAIKKSDAPKTVAKQAEASKAEVKPAEAKPAEAQPAAKADDKAPAPVAKPEPAPVAKPTPAAQPQAAPAATNDGKRVFASPLARRLARETGIDVAQLSGSGPHGRVVRVDVEAAKAKGIGTGARPGTPAGALSSIAPSVSGQLPALIQSGDFEVVPLSTMRKVIAQRLQESKQTIPHFYLTLDVELDALLALRKQLNEKRDDLKITVNDLLIRACGMALAQVPECNVIWTGNQMMRSKSYDVSVAVAIDGGLITPIVRNADRKGLGAISAEMKDKAERARKGKLLPEEYQGGCFALSNLGMFGIKHFQAIINPPQCSILAVGVGEQRPIVKNGALTIATVMSATLSCDHRAIDGALGAKWLNVFKKLVEDPLTMML